MTYLRDICSGAALMLFCSSLFFALVGDASAAAWVMTAAGLTALLGVYPR